MQTSKKTPPTLTDREQSSEARPGEICGGLFLHCCRRQEKPRLAPKTLPLFCKQKARFPIESRRNPGGSPVELFNNPAKSLILLVGVEGFEPPTPSSRTMCATRLRYTPRPDRGLITAHIAHCKTNGRSATSKTTLSGNLLDRGAVTEPDGSSGGAVSKRKSWPTFTATCL